jgi:hypothetical protein
MVGLPDWGRWPRATGWHVLVYLASRSILFNPLDRDLPHLDPALHASQQLLGDGFPVRVVLGITVTYLIGLCGLQLSIMERSDGRHALWSSDGSREGPTKLSSET